MSTLSEVLSSGSGKESTYQCRKHTFHPWIGKIPWKRAWNPFQYSGLENPIDSSPPGSSVHEIFQARILEWVPCPLPGDLPHPGIEPLSPASQADSLLLSHQ